MVQCPAVFSCQACADQLWCVPCQPSAAVHPGAALGSGGHTLPAHGLAAAPAWLPACAALAGGRTFELLVGQEVLAGHVLEVLGRPRRLAGLRHKGLGLERQLHKHRRESKAAGTMWSNQGQGRAGSNAHCSRRASSCPGAGLTASCSERGLPATVRAVDPVQLLCSSLAQLAQSCVSSAVHCLPCRQCKNSVTPGLTWLPDAELAPERARAEPLPVRTRCSAGSAGAALKPSSSWRTCEAARSVSRPGTRHPGRGAGWQDSSIASASLAHAIHEAGGAEMPGGVRALAKCMTEAGPCTRCAPTAPQAQPRRRCRRRARHARLRARPPRHQPQGAPAPPRAHARTPTPAPPPSRLRALPALPGSRPGRRARRAPRPQTQAHP